MARQVIRPPESDSSERWEAQLRKGCLEMAVLASLWNGSLYGLEILRVLERDSSLVLAEGTIYPILNRLRTEGLVESEWGIWFPPPAPGSNPAPARGGSPVRKDCRSISLR